MDKRKIFTIITLILISVMLIAASPDKSDLVSLVIENNSKDYVTLSLNGPQFYYLMVAPFTTTTYTIERGNYAEQVFYSCGDFVDTEIDFNKKQAIIVPQCGEQAFKTPAALNPAIDAGKLSKLIKVTFENPFNFDLILILSGPSQYVLTIDAGSSEDYTIVKGDYEVTQYGCSVLKVWNYYPFANKVKELSCPSN